MAFNPDTVSLGPARSPLARLGSSNSRGKDLCCKTKGHNNRDIPIRQNR